MALLCKRFYKLHNLPCLWTILDFPLDWMHATDVIKFIKWKTRGQLESVQITKGNSRNMKLQVGGRFLFELISVTPKLKTLAVCNFPSNCRAKTTLSLPPDLLSLDISNGGRKVDLSRPGKLQFFAAAHTDAHTDAQIDRSHLSQQINLTVLLLNGRSIFHRSTP